MCLFYNVCVLVIALYHCTYSKQVKSPAYVSACLFCTVCSKSICVTHPESFKLPCNVLSKTCCSFHKDVGSVSYAKELTKCMHGLSILLSEAAKELVLQILHMHGYFSENVCLIIEIDFVYMNYICITNPR